VQRARALESASVVPMNDAEERKEKENVSPMLVLLTASISDLTIFQSLLTFSSHLPTFDQPRRKFDVESTDISTTRDSRERARWRL